MIKTKKEINFAHFIWVNQNNEITIKNVYVVYLTKLIENENNRV